MIGFETCGNATVICHDGDEVVLATDPWVLGSPYFGSWTHKTQLLQRQIEHLKCARYVWFSHGHPDHLDPESLNMFRDTRIMLPDHVGSRMAKALREGGHSVEVLKNNVWT